MGKGLYVCNTCNTVYEKKFVYVRHKKSNKHKLNLLEKQNSILKNIIDTKLGNNLTKNVDTKKVKRRVPERIKKAIAATQGFRCKACINIFDITGYDIDHIIPLQYGGTNHVVNLQALCKSCHAKKTLHDDVREWTKKSNYRSRKLSL